MKPAEATERLKALNPFPDGLPPPSFEPVRRALGEPTADPPGQGLVSRGAGRLASVLVPAIAVLATVAVAAAAVVMLGHNASRSKSSGRPVSSRSLLSQFAILRRPQTLRDRHLPAPFEEILSHPPLHRMLLSGLTRVVGWLPNRTDGRVLLFVVAQGLQTSHPTKIWLVEGNLLSPHGERTGGASAAASPYGPGELFPQIGDGYALQLVPDAVTRVKWKLATKTVYPTIKDNVAFAPHSNPVIPGFISVTWYDADGHVIAYQNLATYNKREAAGAQRAIAKRSPNTTRPPARAR